MQSCLLPAQLENAYVRLRQEVHKAAGGKAPPIPVTVRQLEAMVRLSESLAKMGLQTTATVVHVEEALRQKKANGSKEDELASQSAQPDRAGVVEQIFIRPATPRWATKQNCPHHEAPPFPPPPVIGGEGGAASHWRGGS